MGITATITDALVSAGLTAETASAVAPILIGVGTGALGGGAISGLTGGNIGKGIEAGAITGGLIPAGGELGGLTGVGSGLGDVLGGAAGGALGGVATGQKGIAPTLEGAAAGGVAALSGFGKGAPTTGGGAPAAAPASVAPSAPLGIDSLDLSGSGATAGGGSTPSFASPAAGSLAGTSLNADVLSSAPAGAGTGPSPASLFGSVFPGSDLSTTPIPAASGGTGAQPDVLSFGGGSGSAPGAAGPGGAGGPTSIQKLISALGSGQGIGPALGNVATSNPGALLTGGGLAYEALTQPKLPSITGLTGNIQGLASNANAQSAQLQSYLASGTLPPGVQTSIDQAKNAAIAAVRSRYAGMPGASSAEAQDIANVEAAAQAQGSQIAMQLLQQGVTEAGLASGLYQQLLQSTLTQNQGLATSIQRFASAAAGSPSDVTLKLAP